MNQRYYSNVYWHFTGSPTDLDGTLLTKPADIGRYGNLKTLDESTDILVEILRSRKLLATSVEKISESLTTEAFCCVTDIPLKDLPLHARHYGKVALGFRASAIHECFVPIMYLSKDNQMMKQQLIPNGNGSVATEASAGALEKSNGYRIQHPNQSSQSVIQANPFLNFVKITDFSVESDMTFYSEREWRHVGDFEFDADAIEAIIAPAEKLPDLRQRLFKELGYPDTLSLFSWEFLEQA